MQSKLPNIGTSIFTVMSQLAAKHNAVNLGQGFPDFPMSAELIECVNKAMQSGGNQYAHTNGVPLLRERLAEKIKYLYDVNINPKLISPLRRVAPILFFALFQLLYNQAMR